VNHNSHLSRRRLLKSAMGAAALRALPAKAAGSSSRALVCIYLSGGIDSNNMLVPMAQYEDYAAARGALAIPKDSLVQVTSALDQTVYGFHPSLADVAGLFGRNALAVAANIGSPTPPATPDPYLTYFPPGYAVPGWAAQMAGVTDQNRAGLFVDFPALLPGRNPSTGVSLVAPGVSATVELQNAARQAAQRAAASIGNAFPATGLGQQLAEVAELIRAGASLGMDRQVFLCGLGGPGTMASPLATQAALLQELNDAVAAFYSATLEIGVAQSVTTYTDTEFSRTLRPNASGRTSPAWGSQELVIGGSVLGGTVYGTFPSMAQSALPRGRNGLTARKTSDSKRDYLATLARWCGLSDSEISTYLAVPVGELRTLGFMVTG